MNAVKFRIILIIILLMVISIIVMVQAAFAAVGCTLNNPDSDVKRLFPESTSYKTEFIQIDQNGGKTLYEKVQKLLGDRFDNIYETIDVPYAYYKVYKGNTLIGYIHGVNQKGKYGGMQIILATNPQGKILDWYYQKLSSPDASELKSDKFKKEITGLTLADFYKHDYFITNRKFSSQDRVAQISDPIKNSNEDFLSTIRGIRKNLILLDQYWLNRLYEPYWIKSQKLLNKK